MTFYVTCHKHAAPFLENYLSAIHENENTESYVKPTKAQDVHFIFFTLLRAEHSRPLFGKWMVFKHFDEIDETWEMIRTAVAEDKLQGSPVASVSSMRYNPSMSGPGPDTSGVICVYTQEHDMDAIGFKLIEMAKQDIKYKTDQASINGEYSFTGSRPVSLKTIYWNNGRPSFVCEDRPCYGTSYKREDIWHLNVVDAPESLKYGEIHGRWVLSLEYAGLTGLWHFLKEQIESPEENFGVIRMVCPPKRVRKSQTEMPEFHLYTNKANKKAVGLHVIKFVGDDIVYEYKPQKYGHTARPEVLYWNDGEPDYEVVKRKGITKNWRTGEDN